MGGGTDDLAYRSRLRRRMRGVSVNDLTDEMQVDPLCGTAVLNAVPVTVVPGQKAGVKAA